MKNRAISKNVRREGEKIGNEKQSRQQKREEKRREEQVRKTEPSAKTSGEERKTSLKNRVISKNVRGEGEKNGYIKQSETLGF